jgi:hypothetical protein
MPSFFNPPPIQVHVHVDVHAHVHVDTYVHMHMHVVKVSCVSPMSRNVSTENTFRHARSRWVG